MFYAIFVLYVGHDVELFCFSRIGPFLEGEVTSDSTIVRITPQKKCRQTTIVKKA